MFYREKEDLVKTELDKIYKSAVKEEGDLFKVLKKALEDNLAEDTSMDKLNTYKMVCENYGFVSFNLAVVSVIVAIMAIILKEITSVVVIIVILYGIAVPIWVIAMNEKERRYKYLAYVLDFIKNK